MENCPMYESMEQPCKYYECTPRIRFNYKLATFIMMGSCYILVIVYTLILVCRPHKNVVEAIEDVEEAAEAVEPAAESSAESSEMDFPIHIAPNNMFSLFSEDEENEEI